ncbi:hypothetical protein OAK06_02920 [Gammaproteobacteria bacterium]|nr:hypothetical protein [Gammaproteobacteria bacterium]|tara:strand:- start:259 stop:444 length:186 start_codon:yes stop_codon:yes gene_type:complete
MTKEEIMSLTTQFFRETKGGTRPDDLTPDTYSLIYKNLKDIEKVKTPGVQRMVKIYWKSYS